MLTEEIKEMKVRNYTIYNKENTEMINLNQRPIS